MTESTAIRHDETVGIDLPVDLYSGYEIWKKWDRLFTYTAEEAAYFTGEMTNIRIEGGDLLEIGFGSGSFLAWARDHKANITGTEIIPELIKAADYAGVELLPAEFERVASDYAERFDTIVAFDVFEHFTLQEIAVRLKACEIILKIGGNLILRFPNAQSPFGLAPQNGDPTHKTALSRSFFEQLTQGTGLKVVRYTASFRISGVGVGKRIVRTIRYVGRDLIAATLNALYSQAIPWDPVVVLVMRKTV